MASRRGPGEKQSGEIPATDQQHHTDHELKQQQRLGVLHAKLAPARACGLYFDARFLDHRQMPHGWWQSRIQDAREEAVHLRCGLRPADARVKAGEGVEPKASTIMLGRLAIEHGLKFEWQINIRMFGGDYTLKSDRRHADDGRCVVGDSDVPPDDRGIGVIPIHPDAITDHRRQPVRPAAWLIVGVRQQPAGGRSRAQSLKGIAAHDRSMDAAIETAVPEWEIIHTPGKDIMQ